MGDIELEPIKSEEEQPIDLEEDVSTGDEQPAASKVLFSRGLRLYICSIFTGSLMTATAKYAMQDVDQNIVTCIRMAGTFIFSVAVMLHKGTEGLFWGVRGLRRILFVRGFVGTLNLACVYYAIRFMPLPDYSAICFLTPLITAASAHFMLGEPYNWAKAAASVISLLGVLIITRPSFLMGHSRELPAGVPSWRYYTAILCVLLQDGGTTTILLLLRKIGGRISPFTIMSNYAFQAVIFSIFGFAWTIISQLNSKDSPTQSSESPSLWPSKPLTWVIMLMLAIFGFLYQYFLTLAVTAERASVLTQFDYIGLVFAMCWQFLIWRTLPDLVSILGSGLILLGVSWTSRSRQD